MRLEQLIEGVEDDVQITGTIGEMEVTGLTADSRAVEPGFLFAALPGAKADGRDFIPQAIKKGAGVLLLPKGSGSDAAPCLESANPRRLFATLAARFYAPQPDYVAAVTGTNGKTSVAAFLRQIWTIIGHKAASMGTLGVTAPGLNIDGGLTTPDPVALHQTLQQLHEAGVDHLAMEASSHGLDQYRLDGVKLMAAGFTNLSRDHLDYHGDMAAYFEAKTRLFSELLPKDGCAVLNADAPEFEHLNKLCQAHGHRVIAYGKNGTDIRLIHNKPMLGGQDLTLGVLGETHQIHLPLIGEFQAMNALCALGLALCRETNRGWAVAALKLLKGAPGRMECVATLKNGAAVIVDYAHTPDALETALKALRPHAAGKLSVVFGCGGDRDRGKRSQMGAVAARLSDATIVTDDNPRGENANTIRKAILTGCPAAQEIGDRAKAIARGMDNLRAGDILLVAGKGHERGQIIGETVLPFSDHDAVRAKQHAMETNTNDR